MQFYACASFFVVAQTIRAVVLSFFLFTILFYSLPIGFNTTQKLFDAVQGALRLEFVVDQGMQFNQYLAAYAQFYDVKPLFESRVGTACCGDSSLRFDVFQLPSDYAVGLCGLVLWVREQNECSPSSI